MAPLPHQGAAEGLPAYCGRRVLHVNPLHRPRKTAGNRNRDGFGFERKGLAGWRTCMQNGDEDRQFRAVQRRLVFCVRAAIEPPDPNPGLARRAAKYLPQGVGKACRRGCVEFGVRVAHPLDINNRHVLWGGAQAMLQASAGCAQGETTEPGSLPRRNSLQIAQPCKRVPTTAIRYLGGTTTAMRMQTMATTANSRRNFETEVAHRASLTCPR